jgi:hypothetical protein
MDRIAIDNINIIATYSFKEIDCAICKHPLVIACPKLIQSLHLSNSVSIGQCSHIFHTYCINKYIELFGVCPCDLNGWVVKSIIDI